MENLSPLEKFQKIHKPKEGKTKLWSYKEDIKELLENGYMIKQIYEYLRDFRQIKQKPRTVYDFIQRNRDKILNSQPEPVKEEIKEEPVKEEIKKEPIKVEPQPIKQEQKPEQKIKTTPADRKKEFKRYLEHWDRQPENYLQYIEEKVDEKEFTAVMNRLIEEKLITDFEDIENFFKEPYRPQYICDYISTCRDKLRNKKNFKAFTPAMFQHFMDDNFFAKPKPEQL